MYQNESDKQKLKWGAAGQCLLIVLSFLPVWLMSANDVPEVKAKTPDTLTTIVPAVQWTAEAPFLPDVPRP
ncbi:MAG: hypothetical protein KDD19_11855 [Phaeodactylibacter sp.]|nr:hypothetical protein [Phaeodactylibacter sp.]MCB9049627.1 hypothetical protein [Lewinellaceae bacterium]